MNIQTGVQFHNRFDVELRDACSGELKQHGIAENIVLDQAYSRLCAMQTYFVNIHFGRGSGDLTPTANKLFGHWGTKAATTSETIKAIPVSSWTRYIRLEPTEFNGTPITEVGVAFGATNTNLCTHAMIKDAEGAPLSITKSELDILYIYATVYATLNSSDGVGFTDMPTGNGLLNYLLGGSACSNLLQLDHNIYTTHDPILHACGQQMGTQSLTVTDNQANKKRKWQGRINVGTANGYIQALCLKNVMRAQLGGNDLWNKFTVVDQPLTAVGTDYKEVKITTPRPTLLDVKVNGAPTTNYTISSSHMDDYPYKSMDSLIDTTTGWVNRYSAALHGEGATSTSGGTGKTAFIYIKEDSRHIFKQYGLSWSVHGQDRDSGYGRYGSVIILKVSFDGITFDTTIVNCTRKVSAMSGTYYATEDIYAFSIYYSGGAGAYEGYLNYLRLSTGLPMVINVLDDIAETDVITATYSVPGILKTSDHILDVAMEVQFGPPLLEEITSFDAIANKPGGTVANPTYANAAAVITTLPTMVKANAGSIFVPVASWTDTDTYDLTTAGTYTFTAVLGAIPEGYANTGDFTANVKVIITE